MRIVNYVGRKTFLLEFQCLKFFLNQLSTNRVSQFITFHRCNKLTNETKNIQLNTHFLFRLSIFQRWKRAFSLRAIAIDTFKKALSTFLYWKKKGILALAIVVVIKIPAFLTTRKNMINEGLGGKGMAISLYLSNYSISTASTNK